MAAWGIEPVGMTSFGMEYRVVKFCDATRLAQWIARRPEKRQKMYNCDLHGFMRHKAAFRLSIGFGQAVRIRDCENRSQTKRVA